MLPAGHLLKVNIGSMGVYSLGFRVYMVNIGVYRVYIGIMEKKVETIIMGYIGCRMV